MGKDCYLILGVSRRADSAAIHSAFRALVRRYHPDAGKESSSQKFREVVHAYRTLSDPARRRQHDFELGRAARSREVAAEPLFAGADFRTVQTRRDPADWDELLMDLLRFVESEFDFPLRSPRDPFF